MNITIRDEPMPTYTLPKTNTRQIKLNNTMWPAVMATNKRTANEMGLVKIPNISTGKMINLKGSGTPGVQKI